MPVDDCFAEMIADRRNELRRPRAGTSLTDVRSAASAFMRTAVGPPVARVDDVTFEVGDGTQLPLRIYRPTVERDLPVVIFCHGGGFVFGDLETHDAICRSLAVHSGSAIAAVSYRLAPESPFPVAVEDCTAAVLWLKQQAAALDLQATNIAIAGDSAGGNIAIGTALAVQSHGIAFRHVALFYPAIDPECASQSMADFGKGYLLTREGMQWYWECYLPADSKGDARAAVLEADLQNFPPTTIVTAEFDPLRDEAEQFAERLRRANVSVELVCFPGMVHGFAGMPQVTPQASGAIELVGRALNRSFNYQPGVNDHD